jgi:hypothetical protein
MGFQMTANNKKKQLEAKPLFVYVLNFKVFLAIYFVGFLAMLGWVHVAIQINDSPTILTAQIGTVIYSFLAPTVFILAKRIFKEFNQFFKVQNPPIDLIENPITESEELANLFLDSNSFDTFRSNIILTVNNSKHKIISIILGAVFFPLNLLQDFQKMYYAPIFSNFPFSLQAIEYLSYNIFWTAIYILLFSIILLIFSVTYTLLRLKKEKKNLQITTNVTNLVEKSRKNQAILKKDIEQLNASFQTFSSSLSIISCFIVSLSLKIAFVGAFSTIPAIIYFGTTGRISVVWYGACIMACSLSIAVFILGQYGAWSVWSETKKKAIKLLVAICAKYKEICPMETIEGKAVADIDCINKTKEDIEKATPVTYTSSAVFKVASANLLAFGPIILEQIVTRLILK